ncbi:MAG: hypothetical protein HYV67_04355 [Candidatus Taylorbacteria bacterium]|nr:hypothetical protein [Candidatus Taylorbacteria bacterium]
MGREKIILRADILRDLYWKQNLTPVEIGKRLHCSFKTVRNRLKEAGISFKNPAIARMRYAKSDCIADPFVKSYMLGFRLGDLNVYKRGELSETIVVRCHTTQKEQVSVIKSLFEKFGRVSVTPRGGHFTVNCFLNRTFEFLLPKTEAVWQWIRDDVALAPSFVAGYVDAEANFIINQGRGRLKIDSYDRFILEWICSWLSAKDISYRYRCIRRKGPSWRNQPPLNGNLWRLNISEAGSLEKFIREVFPFLRHANRIRGAKQCLRNVELRRNNGSIK